jgi:hypothetical protein
VETRKRGTTEPRAAQAQESRLPTRFDTAARADQKYTLAFTDEELEALEDLKLELRRRYDVRTTKTELVRCGLWDLIEDHRRNGEQSRALKRLRALAKKRDASASPTE